MWSGARSGQWFLHACWMWWAHPVSCELQQSSPITAEFSVWQDVSIEPKMHFYHLKCLCGCLSLGSLLHQTLCLIWNYFCFYMFFTSCLSINSMLGAGAPEISSVKPMSCASGAWVFPLGCFCQSKVFQTFVIFGFLWSTINIMYLQHTKHKERVPNFMGQQLGVAGIWLDFFLDVTE